jgi:threonine/homoserine/homoserine lactone efflux protein
MPGLGFLWRGLALGFSIAAPVGPTAAEAAGDRARRRLRRTFVLTLTNPTTILSFVAVFAGLGLGAGATGPVAAGLAGEGP